MFIRLPDPFLVSLGALVCVIAMASAPNVASAAPVYRCNGRVQFRPCECPLQKGGMAEFNRQAVTRRAPETLKSAGKKSAAAEQIRYAQVEGPQLVLNPDGEDSAGGRWLGTVRGNGTIHLQLQILRQGNVEAVRYMGSIALANDTSTFDFRAPLPHGKDWKWKIIAFAS